MKKLLLIILVFCLMCWVSIGIWGYTWPKDLDKIYTKEESQVVDTWWLDDPIKAWTKTAIDWTDLIKNDQWDAQKTTLSYISKWVNYFLALLWLISIILIIKDWFVIITAWWDENKQKEAFKNVKNYILAIILIGITALIVNFIFWVINKSTWWI